MAVVNSYVTPGTVNVSNRGNDIISFVRTFSIAAADSDGSIYRLFKVNGNAIATEILINADTNLGASDIDVGLYDTLEQGGAVKDADCYLDGGSISGGKALGSELSGLGSIAGQDLYKQVYEIAGDSKVTPNTEYDLAITANTVGTSAGYVTVRATFAKTT